VGVEPAGRAESTWLTGNIIAFNNAGLASAQGGTLVFQGNDLSRQYLQFVSGDLTAIDTRLAIDLRGERGGGAGNRRHRAVRRNRPIPPWSAADDPIARFRPLIRGLLAHGPGAFSSGRCRSGAQTGR
jgi:hypothetical protein